MKRFLLLPPLALLLTSCATEDIYQNGYVKDAEVNQTTKAGAILESLPVPTQQVPVVVYEFQDQTGQFKSNDNFGEYSSAVTKGGLAVLVESLLDTSNGNFFMVAERGGLNNLLKERQIIRSMRQEYSLPGGQQLPDVQPMIYGGVILEGGIIFYDSNVMTGGLAAGYFGINASTQYRRDIVTIYLRAVEVQSGRVLLAVNSSKTIFSVGVSTGLIRYLALDRLLEAETGVTVNEPAQLAVRQAIESAVYSLVMEGAQKDLWSFNDKDAGGRALAAYIARRDKTGSAVVDEDSRLNADAQRAAGERAMEEYMAKAPKPAAEQMPENGNPITAWFDRNFGWEMESPGGVVVKKPVVKRVPPPNELPTHAE